MRRIPVLNFKEWIGWFLVIVAVGGIQYAIFYRHTKKTVSEGVCASIQPVKSMEIFGLELDINGGKEVTTDADVILSWVKNPGPIPYKVRASGRVDILPREAPPEPGR